ncbi:hypothetical protein MNBD_GAMMA23-883 [hydrothermal vent metagenome]|uniref:DUF2069 domain-containing protein n=1 Tax=hydrothermal vent metagenome TaxID=652676 RepID=A0A3B0ZXC4_9ZZZZ
MSKIKTKADFYYFMTLTGYFGLLILLSSWIIYFDPPKNGTTAFALLFILTPLLLALRGLLNGKRYTYAWSSMLILFYFMHGVVDAWANENKTLQILALIEVGLTVIFFIGSIMYVKYKSRELGQKLEPED